MQRMLVLDRKNINVYSQGTRLTISGENLKTKNIPIKGLVMVLIVADIGIRSSTLNLLSENNIPITILNPRNSNKVSLVYGKPHKNSYRRYNQYKLLSEEKTQRQLASQIVKAKTLGQLNTLKHWKIKYPEHRKVLFDAFNKIQNQYQQIPSTPYSLDFIRGIEGANAAIYFSAIKHIMPESFGFFKRVKRPPTDPLNSLLSLSYTLLNSECSHGLYATGFDPMLGVLHSISYGRDSLACDMSELYRARLDRWVINLFKAQIIKVEHFNFNRHNQDNKDALESSIVEACLLEKAGRQIFYSHWQTFVKPLRRLIRKTAFGWSQMYLQNDAQPLNRNISRGLNDE